MNLSVNRLKLVAAAAVLCAGLAVPSMASADVSTASDGAVVEPTVVPTTAAPTTTVVDDDDDAVADSQETPGGVANGGNGNGAVAGVAATGDGPAVAANNAGVGSLAVTGGDIAGLALLGLGAVAAGAALLSARRRVRNA